MYENGWIESSIGDRGAGYKFDRDQVKKVLDESVYETTANLHVKLKKDEAPIQMRIHGTTFSGSAVRTTLGNTLRVILYWDFVCHELNIKHDILGLEDNQDIFIFVSGDDNVMWSSPATADIIE